MRRFMTKKALILLAAVAAAIGLSVSAYAYFTNAGSGAGTASVGTSSAIELSSDLVGTLYPGGADVPVTVNIHNPGSGNQYVGTISGSVQTQAGCLGSWFTVDSINYAAQLAADGSDTADTAVRMNNINASQDACKGLTLDIDWSSN
jgi:hypothetical protein